MQMFGAAAQVPETEEEFELSAGGKVAIGLTFPVWIPLAVALAVIAVPAFIGWVVFEVIGGDMMHANIEKEMSKMSKDILKKFASPNDIHNELKPVKLQLQVVIGKLRSKISQHLEAQQVLLKRLERREVTATSAMTIDVKLLLEARDLLQREWNFLFLQRIKLYDICICDVELQKCIGEGGFAEVYKGKWKGKQVAVKLMKSLLNMVSATEFIREEQSLRYIIIYHCI